MTTLRHCVLAILITVQLVDYKIERQSFELPRGEGTNMRVQAQYTRPGGRMLGMSQILICIVAYE